MPHRQTRKKEEKKKKKKEKKVFVVKLATASFSLINLSLWQQDSGKYISV